MPDSEAVQLKKKTGREASKTAMLRKCHCLALVLYANGFTWADGTPTKDAHDALKAYAETAVNYRGSLSDISYTRLVRLCASLEKITGGKKHKDPREKFFIDNEAQAQAASNAGRKGSNIDGIARPADLQLIQAYADRLGWDRLRLEGWIRKALGKVLSLNEIKTERQVNLVLWSMKRMLRSGGGKNRF